MTTSYGSEAEAKPRADWRKASLGRVEGREKEEEGRERGRRRCCDYGQRVRTQSAASYANSKSLFAGTGKGRDMAKIREGNRGRGDTHEGLSGEHYGERCLESAGKRGGCEDKRGRRLRRRRRRNMTAADKSVVAQFLRGIFSVVDSTTITNQQSSLASHHHAIIIFLSSIVHE